ncbi:MAG: hypothetical protein MI723_12740 [Caulobacterales bacterium]|nr:hypothetical protein [Caulobacterales bacterium]
MAAMFSSGFCAACRIMNPRVNSVKAEFEGRAVEFITFDQTASLVTGRRLERLAADKGVSEAWDSHRGGTGFLLLIDPADGRVVDRLTISSSADDIRARIHTALRP